MTLHGKKRANICPYSHILNIFPNKKIEKKSFSELKSEKKGLLSMRAREFIPLINDLTLSGMFTN